MAQINGPQKKENRILEAMAMLAESEAKQQIDHPTVKKNDNHSLDYRKKNLESITAHFNKSRDLTPEERKSLLYANHALRTVNARIKPNVLNYLVYRTLLNKLINFLIFNGKSFAGHDQQLGQKEDQTIVSTNLKNLTTRLKELGFKNSIESSLKFHIAHGMDNFSIRTSETDAPGKTFEIHFKRIPDTKAYYIEQYDFLSHPTLASVVSKDAKTTKISYKLHGDVEFSRLEAQSLYEGRPVLKKIDGKKEWFSNDLTTGKTTFDIEKELAYYPIKELAMPAKKEYLMEALQAGKAVDVQVTLLNGRQTNAQVSVKSDLSGLVFKDQDGYALNLPDPPRKQTQEEKEALQRAKQIQDQAAKNKQSHKTRQRVA